MNAEIKHLTLSLTACALLALGLASPASAEFGVVPGSFAVSSSTAQAGGHGDFVTTLELNRQLDPDLGEVPDGNVKSLFTDLPPGLVGNTQAYPKCSSAFLNANKYCPAETQIGTIQYLLGFPGVGAVPVTASLHNMVPSAGRVAEFAFENIFFAPTPVHLMVSVGPAPDYRVTAGMPVAPGNLKLTGATVTVWGVPADSSHDPFRGAPNDPIGGCLVPDGSSAGNCPSHLPPRPFMSNPTRCGDANEVTLRLDAWENPGAFLTETADLGAMSGCEVVPFDPAISLKPDTKQAGTPSSYSVDLHIPQTDSPLIPSTSHLKKAVVTLPEGVQINPAAAAGLAGCTDAQLGLGSAGDANCPPASKIGSVQVKTPLLPGALQGAVYQGSQTPDELLRIFIVAKGYGVNAKLEGAVDVDPDTGRLTTTFDNNPQLPFEDFVLNFKGGSRAPLITPEECGTYTTEAQLTPWARPAEPVTVKSSFEVTEGLSGGPCASAAQRPFAPGFEAGTVNPVAGAFSPFGLRITRGDGSQELTGLEATLPPGLAARFADIPYCPDSALAAISGALGTGTAQLVSPSCPAASQIGTVTAGAGVGFTPFYLDTGRAYLAGPYKGAPLSIAVVTPAVAGPLDLGNVMVRSALHVDPTTAQGRAVSDSIPTALHGIPLTLRDLRIDLNRPRFTLNPTSCDEMAVNGTISGANGKSAAVSQRFQVGSCSDLGFKPKLSLRLAGPTKRGKHPALRAVLQARPGDANIGRVQAALPRSAFLDQANIRTVCTRVQFAADACPEGSVYGKAVAHTPLLDQPLSGPVYLRSSDNKLPDLVAALSGPAHQPIEIELAGRIDTVRGGIRTTFAAVPDAPVSKFVLTMQGGKRKGLIVNSRNLCAAKSRADVKMDGQNGKVRDFGAVVKPDCRKGRKRKGKRR